MNKKVAVLDFDGTLTDTEKEAIPFCEGWEEDLADMTGISLAEVCLRMRKFGDEVFSNPTAYAWEMGGHKVAPAVVDPYIRATVATRKLFDALGLFTDGKEKEAKCQELFAKNYLKSATVFRDGARELIEDLQRVAEVYIVTNSKTEPVLAKLEKLGAAFPTERVVGSAKKYEIDPEWRGVPESLLVPGFSRPVLLRRKRYYEVLEKICRAHGVDWQNFTVIGDIFELDLALPKERGCRVGLLLNKFALDHEIAFLKEHAEQSRVLSGLHEVVPFVME